MLISQMEGYFENPQYHFLKEPVLFLLALKPRKSVFQC